MRPLTARQTEVLELIKTTMLETGMPPTRAEIARQLGFRSANAAEEHLKAFDTCRLMKYVQNSPLSVKSNKNAKIWPIKSHYRSNKGHKGAKN